MRATPVINPRVGWILYDGACGFCNRWISASRQILSRYGFVTAPLQADWVQSRLQLSQDELLRDIRLLLNTGAVVCGADVYREIMKRIWWAWPGYALSCVPGMRQFFNWAYRTFARNRFRVSVACGLHGEDHPTRV